MAPNDEIAMAAIAGKKNLEISEGDSSGLVRLLKILVNDKK